MGINIKVDVDVVKSKESFGISNRLIRNIDAQEVIYFGDRLLNKILSKDVSLMDRYLESYKKFQRVP